MAFIPSLFAYPQKIVSINACTDQILMLLADRKQIASLSQYATQPEISAMADEALGIPQNHGLAEEIMMLNPDLILASSFGSRPTILLLKSLGYKIVEVPYASTFEDIRLNITTIAKAIDKVEQGKQLIANFDQRLLAIAKKLTNPSPIAVFYRESSYTTGDNTLANAILEAAGIINFATKLGISGSGYLSLEALITHHSDIIIMGRQASINGSVASAVFRHPAFKQYKANHLTINIREELWVCGTPFVLEAVDHLVSVRQHWKKHKALR